MRKLFLSLLCLLIVSSLLCCCDGGGGGGGGAVRASEGTATLEWTVPTTDIDGNPLTVTGYNIYYGTESGTYTSVIDVGNVNTYTVFGLSTGYTYYFVITAYDASGVESDPTDEQSKAL